MEMACVLRRPVQSGTVGENESEVGRTDASAAAHKGGSVGKADNRLARSFRRRSGLQQLWMAHRRSWDGARSGFGFGCRHQTSSILKIPRLTRRTSIFSATL